MERIVGIVFDMDDTLYLERDYVLSGFYTVARFLAIHSGICQETFYEYMVKVFEYGNRRAVFNQVLKAWPKLESFTSLHDLVQIYRNHDPCIEPLPGIPSLMECLKTHSVRLGLISDGYLSAQSAKFRALGIKEFIDPVIFTDVWGREFWKPHTRAFELISTTWCIPHDRLMYIGDNPLKDFIAPRKLGWRTVRLRIPGQIYENEDADEIMGLPDYECTSVQGLVSLFQKRHE